MSYTFTTQTASPQATISIAMSSTGSVILASKPGNYLYLSTDSGVTWTPKLNDTNRSWNGATVSADGTKMASCVYGGNVWVSTDSGANWTEQTGISSNSWTNVRYTRDGTQLFLTGYYTQIYKSTDNGASFASIYATTREYKDIAVSDDGNKVIVSVYGNPSVYGVYSGSWTWNTISGIANSGNCAISADGTKLLLGATSSQGIRYSINGGTTWASATGVLSSFVIGGLVIAADGTRVTCYGVDTTTVYTTTDITSGSWDATSIGAGGCSYMAGSNSVSFVAIARITTNYILTGSLPAPPVICFRDGSKILTFNPATGREQYTAVENVRPGTLVKTRMSGYVPVCMVGTSTVTIPNDAERTADRLYVCTKEQFPELTEDLYITGHHSILVNNMTDAEREECAEEMGRVYMTEGRCRLPAHIDRRTRVYEAPGAVERIWHFALENNDEQMNYGVYANGLLVESCSIWRLRTMVGYELMTGNVYTVSNTVSAPPARLPILC